MPSPIFDAPLTSTLVPTTAGNPAFTFTRATTAYVADNENILRQSIANEARFQGARRVRNWLIATDFASGWTTPNGTTKTTGVLDPLGGNTAVTMTCTIFPTLQFYMGVTLPSNALQVRNSVWLRIRSGSPVVQMTGGNNVNVTIPVTSTWQRFAVPVTVGGNAGSTTYFHNTTAVSANPGDAIDVWQPQMEVVDGQSNQAPGEYVSVGVLAAPYHGNAVDGVKYFPTTNGNSVAGNIVTEAQGTLIPTATLLGYLAENASTNQCIRSQEFDNAAWVKTNITPPTPNTQTAPDGTLTAEALVATGVNGTCLQSVTVTATTWCFSVYLKRLVGTGQVAITTDGVTFVDITSLLSSSAWVRVDTNKALSAGAVTPGVRLAVSGDSVAIWGAQLE